MTNAERVALARRVAWPALAASLVWTLAIVADGYLAHGLDAAWYLDSRGERVRVDRTVEVRPDFPSRHRAVARYIDAWDFARFGDRASLPPIDAFLSGAVVVPDGPPRRLRAEGSGEATVHSSDTALRPGVHPVVVRWHDEDLRDTHFILEWEDSPGVYTPVPTSALTPIGVAPIRWGLLALTLVLSATLAIAIHVAMRSGSQRPLVLCAMVFVIALGGALRFHEYTAAPHFRANDDELFAMWNGYELLASRSSVGWTAWSDRYGDRVEHEQVTYFMGRPFQLIRPYFEHPPLMHLLAGAANHLAGVDSFLHSKHLYGRVAAILLSLVTLGLLMALARELDVDPASALFAGLLYAVIPIFVLQNRIVKEEALLTPLAVACSYFLALSRDERRAKWAIVAAAVCAGLCVLTKIPGVVLIPTTVMALTAERRYREGARAAAIALATGSLVLVYAAAIDWDVFVFTQKMQSSIRPSHFNLFPRYFDAPLVNQTMIGRGWLLFVWVGFAASMVSDKRRALLAVPVVAYLFSIGLSAGNWNFGWYMLPVYPFLCVGAGRFLAKLWREPDFFRGGITVMLLLFYTLNFTLPTAISSAPELWGDIRAQVSVVCIGAMVPYGLAQAFPHRVTRAFARVATAGILLVVLLVCARFVIDFDTTSREYENFDRLPFFDRDIFWERDSFFER